MRFQLSVFGINSLENGVLFRKSFPITIPCRVIFMCSSRNFSISSLMLESLVYLELMFVQGDRYGYNFILLYVDIQFSYHKTKYDLFLPVFFVKHKTVVLISTYVRVFCFISLLYTPVLWQYYISITTAL